VDTEYWAGLLAYGAPGTALETRRSSLRTEASTR